MSVERTVSSSQGRPAEWHDQRITTPKNADKALSEENEHWIGDRNTTDAEKFNEIFQDAVDQFNAKQSRPSRMMGPDSSVPARQKSYYDGIVDGTWCRGKGDQKETPIYEAVFQIGNKDDNGITDGEFDIEHWQKLKEKGHEDEASKYAMKHLSDDPYKARSKRILKKAVERMAALDPEHLVVIRADFHGDEPMGTPHVHMAYVLKATGYKDGMESRVGSVKALAQMGFKKTPDKEYGIVQLHEKFKDIIAEEMAADAREHNYEPMVRKADSGEHRKRSDTDVFREMKKQQEDLSEQQENLMLVREQQEEVRQQQEDTEKEQSERQVKLDRRAKSQNKVMKIIYDFLSEMGDDRKSFQTYGEMYDAILLAKNKFMEDTRAQAQNEAEAAFQVKEDSLDAQRKVVEERERAVAERERENQELILLGRKAKAGQISEGIQPTTRHPERRLPDIDY
ncbi:MAG: hypothetical protein E7188_03850 [Erysipelotrichaceae bacterium]|nr:hypothetical protein [Erysipelotrichaceae bacterium]